MPYISSRAASIELIDNVLLENYSALTTSQLSFLRDSPMPESVVGITYTPDGNPTLKLVVKPEPDAVAVLSSQSAMLKVQYDQRMYTLTHKLFFYLLEYTSTTHHTVDEKGHNSDQLSYLYQPLLAWLLPELPPHISLIDTCLLLYPYRAYVRFTGTIPSSDPKSSPSSSTGNKGKVDIGQNFTSKPILTTSTSAKQLLHVELPMCCKYKEELVYVLHCHDDAEAVRGVRIMTTLKRIRLYMIYLYVRIYCMFKNK